MSNGEKSVHDGVGDEASMLDNRNKLLLLSLLSLEIEMVVVTFVGDDTTSPSPLSSSTFLKLNSSFDPMVTLGITEQNKAVDGGDGDGELDIILDSSVSVVIFVMLWIVAISETKIREQNLYVL